MAWAGTEKESPRGERQGRFPLWQGLKWDFFSGTGRALPITICRLLVPPEDVSFSATPRADSLTPTQILPSGPYPPASRC